MMIKKLFIFTILCSLAFASGARADFEAVETILAKLENLQKKAQNVEEMKKEVESKINVVRQGVAGVQEKVSSVIPNNKKVDVKMLTSLAKNAKDKKGLEDTVGTDLTPNYTDKDQNKVFREVEEKRQASRLKGALRLYAYAFTMRTGMAKSRKEASNAPESKADTDEEKENSREILLQLSNKETAEAARRLSQLWDMQASLLELEMLDAIRGFSVDVPTTDEQGDSK